MPLALILPRGDQWYLLRKPQIRRDKGDTLSLFVQFLPTKPWVPCAPPPASLLFSRLSGLAATGPTLSFLRFPLFSPTQVSPVSHMASTTLVRFLPLLRLSCTLLDPILVPFPVPILVPFISPLLLSFMSALPSSFPSCVRLGVSTPVPVPILQSFVHLHPRSRSRSVPVPMAVHTSLFPPPTPVYVFIKFHITAQSGTTTHCNLPIRARVCIIYQALDCT